MVLHYFLFPFKILVVIDVLVEGASCLYFKQKPFSFQKVIPTYTAVPSALKSFLLAIFACKFTSRYTFINPYNAVATTEGRGGGGGGGGHGKDDWVIPNYSYHSNEFLFKNQQF